MKITEGQLRRIIRQEVQALRENQPWPRNAWPRPSDSTHSYPPISDDVRAGLYGPQEDRITLDERVRMMMDDREDYRTIMSFLDSPSRPAGELSPEVKAELDRYGSDPYGSMDY